MRAKRPIVPQSLRDGIQAGFMRVVRLVRGDFVTVTALGHRLTLDTRDASVAAKLLVWRELEPNETRVFQRLVRPGDHVIDIGAHIGYYAVLAGGIVGLSGRVIAIEPEHDNAALLRANVEQNGLGRTVTVFEAAAGAASGTGTLALAADYNMGDNRMYASPAQPPFRPSQQRDAIDVEVITVDQCTADWKRVDFIKMDAQGYEPVILSGMRRTLGLSPGVVMVTEFWPWGMALQSKDAASFCQELEDDGFHMWEFGRNGMLSSVSGQELRSLPCRADTFTNILCARPEGATRLVQAGLIASARA